MTSPRTTDFPQKALRILLLFAIFASSLRLAGGSSAATIQSSVSEESMSVSNLEKDKIFFVFSDLDGTLLHYPDKIPKGNILKLPPSSTGMRGIISAGTLSRIKEVRQKAKFFLVSGMRTTTFLTRVKFLPKADAYCTEAGGRIFYPTNDVSSKNAFIVRPERYDGAQKEDLEIFAIVEDMEWRKEMEKVTGKFPAISLAEMASKPSLVTPISERDGLLWDFARDLVSKGFVLDVKGYAASFRVNKKHQAATSDIDFNSLSDGTIKPWSGLSTSINLSCVDFYPEKSGKRNCCQYLAERFCPSDDVDIEKLLPEHALCICDDDNDLEMAMACRHAYIPGVSSKSMADMVKKNPQHFTETSDDDGGHGGTAASEAALSLVLSQI